MTTDFPLMRIFPLSALYIPARIFIRVDLPASFPKERTRSRWELLYFTRPRWGRYTRGAALNLSTAPRVMKKFYCQPVVPYWFTLSWLIMKVWTGTRLS